MPPRRKVRRTEHCCLHCQDFEPHGPVHNMAFPMSGVIEERESGNIPVLCIEYRTHIKHPINKRPITARPITECPITKCPITKRPITKRCFYFRPIRLAG